MCYATPSPTTPRGLMIEKVVSASRPNRASTRKAAPAFGAVALTRGVEAATVCVAAAAAGVGAALRGADAPLALLVAGWGEPLDPLWRSAIRQAVGRAADWCVLFNGTHLRLISAERVFSRRFVEFARRCALERSEAMGTHA